uniref:Uncharacterized protein n=1 Tax=Chrysemys picta bellii TaxID=8478 RepID=A0A8C3FA12_CHRPI
MKCPSGQRLTQFRLRVEPCRGLKDNMAAKNIEFVCTGGVKLRGDGLCRGKWGPQSRSLKKGLSGQRLTQFRLREEPCRRLKDDTAANNIEFACTGGADRSCGPRGICTIATKVEAPQGKGDDTALNDVYFSCCSSSGMIVGRP